MRFVRAHAALLWVTFGAVLVAAYLAVRTSPDGEAAVYQTTSVLSAILVVVGLRWRLRRPTRPWRLFAAGIAAYALGDAAWCLTDILGVTLPSDHISDAFYVLSYPLLGGALIGMSASRREPIESLLRQLVDAALLFASAYCAVWFLVIDPVVDRAGVPVTDTVLAVLYPTLDLALLALVARFAFGSGRWPWSLGLMTAAFSLLFVGDITWRVLLANGSYSVSSWINTLFMAGYILWGAAALHPSVAEIESFSVDAAASKPSAAWRRLAVLGLAAVVPALVLVSSRSKIDDRADIFIFGAVIMLLPLLSLVRVADMLRALRRAVADFDGIIASSPVPICVVDREGAVQVWNRAAEVTSGYLKSEVIGGVAPITPAEDPERVAALYADALRGIVHERVDVKLARRDGQTIEVRVSTAPLHTADGRIVALFEDVTKERERQAEIDFLASHDPLTGLPNRRRFEEELAASSSSASAGVPAHVVLFDVDNFKSLNDTGGHAVGDRILRELAHLLGQTVRPGDFLARLSGDEFALILNGIPGRDALPAVERLLDVARDYRLQVQGGMLDVTLSAGVYSLGRDDNRAAALRRADEALYHAKLKGKNRLEVWADRPVQLIGAARSWSPAIKDALRDDRIELHLQPVVSLADGSVAFYEALCRLRLPDNDVIAAAKWIDHAELLGLMPSIDVRMLEHAEKLVACDDTLRVFVNISASSFHDPGVLDLLERTLESVREGSLGIELTEHTTLSDPGRSADLLGRLRGLGAVVAIDDFGLGFTSFNQLATLPCDIVKIPGSFTSDQLGSEGDSAVIAGAIASVAHYYGKSVVIEGIESAAGARQAKLLGVEYAQGWHYGRPAPAASARPAFEWEHALRRLEASRRETSTGSPAQVVGSRYLRP